MKAVSQWLDTHRELLRLVSGFAFGSSRDLKCSYARGQGSLERYVGQIRKFGVDLGYRSGGVTVWAVVAPTADDEKDALAGDLGGVTGGASVGIGGARSRPDRWLPEFNHAPAS
jgi:hypothetical protein